MSDIQWLDPNTVLAPHRVYDADHVFALYNDMAKQGWMGVPLVGYRWGCGIQLLSGTHRRAAAIILGMDIPVKIYPYEEIIQAWGTDTWREIMNPQGDII